MKCFVCNKDGMLREETTYRYLESGLDNVYLEGAEVYKCASCGEEFVNIPDVPKLHNLIGLNLIRKKSLLTGKEIRFLRKNMRLKAVVLAEHMGVDNATVSRWENDSQNISKTHDRFLRLLYGVEKGYIENRTLISEFKDIAPEKSEVRWNIPVSLKNCSPLSACHA